MALALLRSIFEELEWLVGLGICVVKIGVLAGELGLRLLRVRFWIGNLMKVCLLVERVLSCILGLRRFLGLLCIDRHRLHLALVLDICFRDRNGWLVEEHWYRYLVFERIKTRIRSHLLVYLTGRLESILVCAILDFSRISISIDISAKPEIY